MLKTMPFVMPLLKPGSGGGGETTTVTTIEGLHKNELTFREVFAHMHEH